MGRAWRRTRARSPSRHAYTMRSYFSQDPCIQHKQKYEWLGPAVIRPISCPITYELAYSSSILRTNCRHAPPSASQLLSRAMIDRPSAGPSSGCPPANCPPAGQLPTSQPAARRPAHARRPTACTSSPLYLFRQPAARRPAVRRLCLSTTISLLTSYYISRQNITGVNDEFTVIVLVSHRSLGLSC